MLFPHPTRIVRFSIYALIVFLILALELSFVRSVYDRAENYRRTALRQLTDMGESISDAKIAEEEKSELLHDVISTIGKMSPRPKRM